MSNETTSASATGLPDRRLFLATGAAAVVAGAVKSPAHAAEGSELLDLIARNRATRAAFCDAVDVQQEAEARYEAACPDPVLTPSGPSRFYDLKFGYDFCKEGITKDFKEQRQWLQGLARLDPTAGELALAAIDAKEVERLATLDENFAALEARKEAIGLGAADRLWQETEAADRAAAIALLAYPCRTIEEVRIKAEYILSSPLNDEIHDSDLLEPFLRSLADIPAQA